MYRYGAEYCYDVVEWRFIEGVTRRCNPMEKQSFVPSGGYVDCAESVCLVLDLRIAFWSRYVPHYIVRGELIARRRATAILTTEELIAAEVQKEIPEVKEVVLVNEVSPELLDFARKLLNHDHGAQDGLC